jgi:succinate dehydrogenase hydrophobic anchor subunit
MLHNISQIAQTAFAFLSNGKAPPNTPPRLERQMEDTNHLASKKFFIIFSSIIMLVALFFIAVGILFLIPRDHDIVVTTYATIFTKVMEQFALIISVYLGAQGLVDLRYNSSSNASVESIAQSVKEDKRADIKEEYLTNNAKENDYHIMEL